ncbi:MAG: TRAP transporter substrate-binding protein [Geminicoccaceae bacterium]|nr:MAG: TRAP transporter substrate-binding protein [Geminicoccaceae bacterium]
MTPSVWLLHERVVCRSWRAQLGERPIMFRHVAGLAAVLGLVATTADAQTTLRLHTLVQSPHPYNDMAEFMAEQIAERSDGAFRIEIFPGASLGNDPAVIGEMALGSIDLIVSSTNNAENAVPELAAFSLPYLFTSIDDFMERAGPGTALEAHFMERYEASGSGMRLLALNASGTRNFSTARGPVEGLDDISGARMRVPPSPLMMQTWEALGTIPVSVAWAELYAAVQTGVADSLESSIPGYVGSKLFEVAPYLALTAHTLLASHISISEVTWGRLSEEQRALFLEVADEATRLGAEMGKVYDDELVVELQEQHGVTVTQPDPTPFMERLAPVQDALAAQMGLEAELALIRAGS